MPAGEAPWSEPWTDDEASRKLRAGFWYVVDHAPVFFALLFAWAWAGEAWASWLLLRLIPLWAAILFLKNKRAVGVLGGMAWAFALGHVKRGWGVTLERLRGALAARPKDAPAAPPFMASALASFRSQASAPKPLFSMPKIPTPFGIPWRVLALVGVALLILFIARGFHIPFFQESREHAIKRADEAEANLGASQLETQIAHKAITLQERTHQVATDVEATRQSGEESIQNAQNFTDLYSSYSEFYARIWRLQHDNPNPPAADPASRRTPELHASSARA